MLNPDYDLIIRTLCYPGTTWKVPGTYTVFLEKFLRENAAVWYAFLARRLMPVGHTSDVQRESAVVLYALYTGMPIDVGKLIFGQLTMSIHNASLALYFPTIVTELCARAGVHAVDEDELLPPMRAIDDALYKAKSNKRALELPEDIYCARDGGNQAPAASGPPPPPQPRRCVIGDRVNELCAWATYQTQHNVVTDAHLMHLGSMMQGISLHLGVDTSVYPPPPAFPPPFPFQYTYPMLGAAEEGVVPPDDEEEDL